MQKRQVNRAVIAARAAANGRTGVRTGAVSRNLASRPLTTVKPSGAGARHGKVSYSGAGLAGYSDMWAATPYYKTAATLDKNYDKN